jgi:periplasmic divalent cation tolerance protein
MTYIIVYITAKDADEASRIGETLVRERLAACTNVIPEIKSTYWWKGRVEKEGEAVLLLKSVQDRAEQIIRRVRELHSYEVPCIDIVPLSGGNPEYFRWLEESIKPGGGE